MAIDAVPEPQFAGGHDTRVVHRVRPDSWNTECRETTSIAYDWVAM